MLTRNPDPHRTARGDRLDDLDADRTDDDDERDGIEPPAADLYSSDFSDPRNALSRKQNNP